MIYVYLLLFIRVAMRYLFTTVLEKKTASFSSPNRCCFRATSSGRNLENAGKS